MKIEFSWDSKNTTEQQKKEIEEVMTGEIPGNFKDAPEKLTVSLYDLPRCQILTGSAVNENNIEVMNIKYRLPGNTLKIPNKTYELC